MHEVPRRVAFPSRWCPLVNSEICESGYLALSQLANSIHELVRGERAELAAIDTSNVNTCRLDIFVRYDVAGPQLKGLNGTEETALRARPIPGNPPLAPPRICMTILPGAMVEYVSGYWLYIFIEWPTLPGADLVVQFVCFEPFLSLLRSPSPS